MCDIIQELIDEERKEVLKEYRIEEQKRHFAYVMELIGDGSITIEQAIKHETDKDAFIQWLGQERQTS